MKILIIKPSSLGDVIHALPFLKAVKNTWPDSRVDWVISRNLKGIIEDNPLIDDLIILNKDSWKRIRKIPETIKELSSLKKTLKSKHYDMVIDLQGLLRSGLIAYSTPTTVKVGFADSREGSRFFYDKRVVVDKNLHAVDKCLEVAESIGAKVGKDSVPLYINEETKKNIRTLLGNINEYIVIVPSARWPSKRWPAENFASLISKIKIPCIITGSKGDVRIANKIMEGTSGLSNQVINLCGKTGLKELAALIAGAKGVVSNDSGPMHIAAAFGKPVVAIFGPTDPEKTGPYGWQKNSKLSVIRARVPCSPCRRRTCSDLVCMDRINANTVFKALSNIL